MKYNTQIEKILNNIKYDNVRFDDIKKQIFDNQIDTGKDIVKHFTAYVQENENEHNSRNNHVVLVAKMQSGKTGVCNSVVNILENDDQYLAKYFNIDKYLFITGMNDTGLMQQTLKRIYHHDKYEEDEGQILCANDNNVCGGFKELENKKNAKIFVFKNSDLKQNDFILENCLVFIDESHFGSNEENILTKFLTNNGISWKNTKELKDKNIYIVSVSATPYDEIISDISECKAIVELETTNNYVGVSEYYDNDCIFNALKTDFKENENGIIPIIDYIKIAHAKIKLNNNKGVIFIRVNKNQDIIKNNSWIKNTFKIVSINSKNGKNIDYDQINNDIQSLIDSNIDTKTNRPIIFLIKGAYRAGVTIDKDHKDYIYMVYDLSDKREATAQGLLGRMCGYRNDNLHFKKTLFYVNLQQAYEYSEQEKDFQNRINIPVSNKQTWINKEDYDKKTEYVISTKSNPSFSINLDDEQIYQFLNIKSIENKKEYLIEKLNQLVPNFEFDYLGESYLSGKNIYNSERIIKWQFDNFNNDNSCPSFRPDSFFKKKTGRDKLDMADVGKTICHIVLDVIVNKDEFGNISNISGNKKLLIHNGSLQLKVKMKNNESMIKEHKRT